MKLFAFKKPPIEDINAIPPALKPLNHPIEVDFQTASLKKIKKKLDVYGCCVLRNAINPSEVERYSAMLEQIYQAIAARMEKGEKFTDFERIHITDMQFVEHHGSDNSYLKLLSAKFFDFMDLYFGKGHYAVAQEETLSRSVHYQQTDPTSFRPLQLHLDGLYHETWAHFAVNFWIPFSRCGVGTDYPGLTVMPARFQDIRKQISIKTPEALAARKEENNGHIPTEDIESELKPLFQKKKIKPVSLTYDIGDVVLMNSWTPHASFWAPYITSHRRNLEVRFCGDSWNPA